MVSIWKKTSESPKASEGIPEQEADAVIIGGGMAGILTGWFLKKQGINVMILEANEIGSGQTGNTTAKVTSQHGLIYDKLLGSMGKEKALQYARANEEAIGCYKNIIDELQIDCAWERCPAYLYSINHSEELRKEADAALKLGINAFYTDQTELPFHNAGAVCFQKQARFHPLKFLYAVAGELKIYEHVRVLDVEENKVITERGNIHASHIIFAVHYPFINRPGYYFMRMHQERSYVVAVEGAKLLEGMYLGIDEGGLSFRSYGDILLVGGGGHRTGENHAGGQYEMLIRQARTYWPDCQVKAQWSAQDCMTLDGVPYIGRFSSEIPGWYVATGFGKWGMTSSMVAARIISSAVSGKRDENADVFSPLRFTPQASAKNFMKDGIHAAKDLTKRMFASASLEVEQLKAGHGGIVEYDGEKAGVYKEEDGRLHVVSVKCPHLGCQLEWNPQEKSWDCPCHGSRFDYEGNLIDNPANAGLDTMK